MKRRCLFLLVVTVLTIGLTLPSNAATYQIDPAHTSVVFKIKHFDIGYVYGMFLGKSGEITYDPETPDKTYIQLNIETESIFTNVRKRDDHLRSGDFFNAKQYPKITFKSTDVDVLSDTRLRVTGDLTMHGVTKSITTTVNLTGKGNGPQGNFRRGFHTVFTIDRTNFGIDYMADTLSHEVKVIFSGEVIRQ
ncbi:MAG: YceI family protein [bacterium]